MDIAYMASQLTRAGVLPQGLQDAMRRASEAFSGSEPTEAEMDAWTAQLTKDARHLFGRRLQDPPDDETEYTDVPWKICGVPQEVYEHATASQKLTWIREVQAAQGYTPDAGREVRRPKDLKAPAAVREQWKDLSPTAQLTAYREWRDQQQG